jgi:hypothetical protein
MSARCWGILLLQHVSCLILFDNHDCAKRIPRWWRIIIWQTTISEAKLEYILKTLFQVLKLGRFFLISEIVISDEIFVRFNLIHVLSNIQIDAKLIISGQLFYFNNVPGCRKTGIVPSPIRLRIWFSLACQDEKLLTGNEWTWNFNIKEAIIC